jgi:hypothetical protein
MGFHLVFQPLAGYRAEVVSPSPGIRQLVVGDESSSILIQVLARVVACPMRPLSPAAWQLLPVSSASGAKYRPFAYVTPPVSGQLRDVADLG